ncbi:helix-turn-helix domain-containing protein [Halobacterium salinarum]|uniref:ArsR/SmtB family transcription factor n=1 Tax=Halobacterium salinarum TaxID=2242 RepID=UPI002554CADE|nr:helix-turn-helix domain-containing protein [Halobacterium salinarum]MDL0135425.1 helix-turn-helix domain-containing protein [Halobacterium salinarum]
MDPVDVLRVLGNKYNAEILEATHAPRSAQELSDELDIPIATSYRRIEELSEHDLLKLEGKELSDEGRRTKVYRRQVDEISVQFGVNETTVETKERTEAKNALVDVWSDLGADSSE